MTEREFSVSIRKIRPRLIAFASSFMCRGAATAEDMVQDAALKVWQQAQKSEIRNIQALTVTILRNVCLDYIRLKKNSAPKADLQVADSGSQETGTERREKWEYIRNAISTLPPDQQSAVMLRDVMGYEFSEIAQVLDMTEANVRMTLSRARHGLRNKLTR